MSLVKLVTVAFHEASHAMAAVCTGGRVLAIKIDPDEGGQTTMLGGNPYITLPAVCVVCRIATHFDKGYLGSSLIGSVLVFAGFDVTASKIAAVLLALCLLFVLWWASNALTRAVTVLFIGAIALLWWFHEGEGLLYFVLFMG